MIRKKLTDLPDTLYKYCDCLSNQMKILTELTFHFPSPATFNDIFEFGGPQYDTPQLLKKYSALLQSLLKEGRLSNLDFLNRHDFFAGADIFGSVLNDKYHTKSTENLTGTHFFQQFLAVCSGALCFSATHSNNLMWSHYANEHSGCCIGFSVQHLLQLNADFIGKVSYSQQRPQIATDQLPDDEIFATLFFTKSLDWAYEDEYRIVSIDIRERIVRYDINAINSIYLGARCRTYRDLIIHIRDTAFPQVPIYQAKPADAQFDLFFEMI
jgi:hypothetical protein